MSNSALGSPNTRRIENRNLYILPPTWLDMEYVFHVRDAKRRSVRLTKEQWVHISARHSNVGSVDIEQTLCNPMRTLRDEDITIYYRHFKHRRSPAKYLKVIVKYLNGDGFVVTAYFVRHMLQ